MMSASAMGEEIVVWRLSGVPWDPEELPFIGHEPVTLEG